MSTSSITRGHVIAFITILLVTSYLFIKNRRSYGRYPPGPKGLPLLGNLLQFPSSFEWIAFEKWSREIGSDILYLRAFGSGFLILNSAESTIDLFDKRSTIYSSRPQFPMAGDLVGWNWLFVAMEYGNSWRVRRRTFTKYFHPGNVAVFQPNHLKFVRGMLPRLLDKPENFMDITRYAVGGSALSLAYGIPIQKENDPYISVSERAVVALNIASLPGNFMVNLMPVLKHVPEFFPCTGFKKLAKKWKKLQEDFRELPFETSMRNWEMGQGKQSLTTHCLENLDESQDRNEQLEIIKDTAAQRYKTTAAAETTLSAIHTFFLAMICYPDVQKTARKELDRVLQGRLPDFSDFDDLPYIQAIVKEVLRWRPPAPLAVPHATSEDDIYRGYYIPKGTLVMGNVWAMLHDERLYPEPDVFNPDRFIKNGKFDTDAIDPAQVVFGFGRRICPGSHIALSLLWLTAASILSTLELSKPVDENGNLIEPSTEYQSGIVCQPMPFSCGITPRSQGAVQIIGNISLHDREDVS